MTGNRPFCDEERGGDFPVRATFRNEGRDAMLSRRQPFLAPAPADASKLAASLLDPGCGPELFEAVKRGLARFARAPPLPGPHPDDAEREQCPSRTEGVSDLLVLCNRSVEDTTGAIHLPLGGSDKSTASGRMRQHPLAGATGGIRPPGVEDSDRILKSVELQQELDLVAGPPTNTRLAPSELRGPPGGLLEPSLRCGRISAPFCDESEDRHELHGPSAELFVSESESSFR